MQTIVELPEFQRKATSLLTDTEKQSIINYLAAHPQVGIIMKGTGGIRKFRWAIRAKVVVFESSIIFTINAYHYFYCRYLVKVKKPIFLSQKEMK